MITDVTVMGTLRHRRTPSPARWRNLYCECITFIQPWMMAESTAPLFGQTSRYGAKIVAYGIMQNVYIPFGFVLILLRPFGLMLVRPSGFPTSTQLRTVFRRVQAKRAEQEATFLILRAAGQPARA
jgi:hypothetical protein